MKGEKEKADLGDGIFLYERADGTVYISPKKKTSPQTELDEIFPNGK